MSEAAGIEQSPFLPQAAIFRQVTSLRRWRADIRLDAKRSLGLVPTMGALHDGHVSLVRRAAAENSDVVVSIYVNPTQFGVAEDLSTYPRTWDADLKILGTLDKELSASAGHGRLTAVFAPTTSIMYPTLPPTSEINGHGSFVTLTPIGNMLEGKSRPVFFRGVASVCMKLFNIVQPDQVYFGQKDVQQTVVIRQMIKDFHLPIGLHTCPTEREADGLAMSSRNIYLGRRRRTAALALIQALLLAEQSYMDGMDTRGDVHGTAVMALRETLVYANALDPCERALFTLDYISLADPDTLEEVEHVNPRRGAILSGAIIMQPLDDISPNEELGLGGDTGVVRMIDNIILPPR